MAACRAEIVETKLADYGRTETAVPSRQRSKTSGLLSVQRSQTGTARRGQCVLVSLPAHVHGYPSCLFFLYALGRPTGTVCCTQYPAAQCLLPLFSSAEQAPCADIEVSH